MKNLIPMIAVASLIAACGDAQNPPEPAAQFDGTLIVNADIVTMDPANPTANALAYSGQRIVAVGEEADVRARIGDPATVFDLGGRTVTPGFFETHDHMIMSSASLSLTDISPFTTPTLAEALEKLSVTAPDEDGWVIAFGADQTLYEERRGPTLDLLDPIFPDTPVLITHLSGHGGFANSAALALAGIDENTPDPQGGFFEKDADGNLTGFLSGQPALFMVATYPSPSVDDAYAGARLRAAAGVTTASELAIMNGELLDVVAKLTAAGDLAVRLVGGLFVTAPDFEDAVQRIDAARNDLLRVPFVKTWTDGSLQGGTGDLLEGYYDPEMGGDGAQGTQEMFNAQVKRMYELGVWPAIHANGDGAVETALNAIQYAQQETGMGPDSGIRPQLIHAQVTSEAQIERMAELGVSPTFFTTHVYYWGDLHAERSVGPEKVHRISAMADAFRLGVHPSMHNDPPVSPVNPILNMWIAVNRMSTSGAVYGPEQAITPQQALEAYTINGAYQFGMEEDAGSLEAGKFADFVVLDRNPLKVDPAGIRDIKVEATVLLGRQTFAGGVELE